MTHYKTFPSEKLEQISLKEGVILDVRSPMEHAEKRLTCAHAHVPLDELNPVDFMARHGLDKDSGVYILCRSGKRATQAAEKFTAEGYRNIHVIEGGLVSCEGSGIDLQGHAANGSHCMTAAKTPLSLERQVRIVAGLMAATGALLALLTSPLFAIIPLFVGSGLVFAGVTDRCGMALLLTRAPWNKITGNTSCTRSSGSSSSCAIKGSPAAGSKIGQSCQ